MSWLRDGDDRLIDHLGEDVAGLVDGHLQHQARERALAHLTHCETCRLEVDGLRRMRATLLDLGARTQVPYGLAERLLALPQTDLPPVRLAAPGPIGHPFLVLGPQGSTRPAVAPLGTRRPLGHPGGTALLRGPRVPRAAAAGAALALGLGGVLAIGAPTNRPARPSFEPASSTIRLIDASTSTPRRQDLMSVRPAHLGTR